MTLDFDTRARRRAERARDLARTSSPAASLLAFSASLTDEQLRWSAGHRDEPIQGDARLRDAIDRDAVVRALHELLAWLPSVAPDTLREAIPGLASRSAGEWRYHLDTFLDGLPDSVDPGCAGFVMEAAVQPFAESCAERWISDRMGADLAVSMRCPFCGDRPAAAILREAGHGARRSFVCGICLTEWPAPRIGCGACGESAFDRLPVFRTDDIAAARIDACDVCRSYIKTIDLTRDGHAISVVDDLATVPLDLWAREQGYHRLRPHLLRM